MSKLIPFCSSSKGNCVLYSVGSKAVLIDIGLSFRSLNQCLRTVSMTLDDISAVLITHEHVDHVKGLDMLLRHTQIPVFMAEKSAEQMLAKCEIQPTSQLRPLCELDTIELDGRVEWFRTSHDSSFSVGYTITADTKLGYCTDTGKVTDEARSAMLGSDIVFLESNYDLNLLNSNPRYPFFLKNRIKSDTGHLSNSVSADFAAELVKSGASTVVLGHLSPENNTPELAKACNEKHLQLHGMQQGSDYQLKIAPAAFQGELLYI